MSAPGNGDYEVLGEDGRAALTRNIGHLTRVGEAIGGWEAKYDIRQTGVSYHAKFEQRADVAIGLDFVTQLGSAPAMLADACRRLIAADQEVERLRVPNPLDELIDGWLEWVVETKGPDCRYDHHDLCQNHNLDERPCPMEAITAYVRSLHGITT